jgi:two-component system, sensor histidine kinase LadS
MHRTLWIGLYLAISMQSLLAEPSHFQLYSSNLEGILSQHCEYLEDQDRSLNIFDAYTDDKIYTPITSIQPGFGYTTSAYWLRCFIDNNTVETIDFLLEIAYPQLDDIRFYNAISKSGSDEIRMGDTYPYLQRQFKYRNFVVPLQIKSNSTKQIYLRVASTGALNVPLNLWSYETFLEKVITEQLLLGLFIGIAFVMILYKSFLYTLFHELHYLYYVLFLTGWIFIISSLTGLSFQYLWPNSIWWGNYNFPIMIFFTSVWALLFTRAILDTKTKNYILDRILNSLVYVNAFLISIPFILDYVISIRIALVLAFLQMFLILGTAIYIHVKGNRSSIYFITAWSGFLLGLFIYQMHSFALIPQLPIITWSVHIGASFEIILFSFALADRINQIRIEKGIAQEEVIKMQKDALQNIKTNQKQKEQIISINQELKIARDIHQSILPKTIPNLPGLKIHVNYTPMAEIGGDLYEFIEEESTGNLGILVSDVAGHGIPAAQVASMIKAIFTFHKKWQNKPDRLLKEMNQTLIAAQNNQLVTASYLYIDKKNKKILYSNSGHPPLLIFRKNKHIVESYYPEGKILGWVEDSNNKLDNIPIQEGDIIFIYTDGITEVRRNTNEIWGEENFKNFILDHHHLDKDKFTDKLMTALKKYSNLNQGFEDDLTLLIIEIDSKF